jgi:hypothetical protein
LEKGDPDKAVCVNGEDNNYVGWEEVFDLLSDENGVYIG